MKVRVNVEKLLENGFRECEVGYENDKGFRVRFEYLNRDLKVIKMKKVNSFTQSLFEDSPELDLVLVDDDYVFSSKWVDKVKKDKKKKKK